MELPPVSKLERTLRRTAEQTDSSQLDNRLIWLMVLRVIVVTTLLGSAVTVEVVPQPESQARPLFYLIALTYLLTLAYALAWPFAASFRRLVAYVQIFGDLVIITGTVYFTGGLENNFSLLYFISIISASIILFRAGGLIAAATASVFYATVILTVSFGILPSYPPNSIPSQAVEVYYYSIFFNVFGFFTVASLTSYLSEGLRKTGRELVEASDHLADLQAFNQTVIDSIASGLMTTDLEGKINFLNKSAVNILGVSSEDVVGERVDKILGEGDDYIEYLQEMLAEQRYRRMEGIYLNRRGEQIFLGMSVSYLLVKGEELSGFLFTFQDLTEIKRLEREVRMKENLATMGEMAAGMAHEIRNPLASISGSVQVLKESLGLEGGDSRLMNIIIRESERLSGILNDFLIYARPPRFKPDDIDLREVVEETATLLRNSAEVEADHEIVLKMPTRAGEAFRRPEPDEADRLESGPQRHQSYAGRRPSGSRAHERSTVARSFWHFATRGWGSEMGRSTRFSRHSRATFSKAAVSVWPSFTEWSRTIMARSG